MDGPDDVHTTVDDNDDDDEAFSSRFFTLAFEYFVQNLRAAALASINRLYHFPAYAFQGILPLCPSQQTQPDKQIFAMLSLHVLVARLQTAPVPVTASLLPWQKLEKAGKILKESR